MLKPIVLIALALSASPAIAQECVDYAHQPELLIELEADATIGALPQEAKDCLERSFSESEVQTTKNKISRVLMVNAYAYSTEYWAKLVQRHLAEVDKSDPDIAYLYALHIFNTQERYDPDEIMHLTNLGLERRDVWTGDVHVTRVNALLRLRAVAASVAWTRAEEDRARGVADDEEVNTLRNQTKTFAREWLDFASNSGRDTEPAMNICLQAASRQSGCGIEKK